MTLVILFRTPCSDYHSPAGHLPAFVAQGQQPGSSPGVAPRDASDLVMINPNYPLLLREELGLGRRLLVGDPSHKPREASLLSYLHRQ